MRLLTLLLLAAALCGADFHPAFVQAHEVTFEPFQTLDWQAKARRVLTWLNLDHPTRAQIARLHTSEAAGPEYRSIDFRAPLDPAVNRASYLLITATGVTPIRPTGLKGSVDFFFDAAMSSVDRRVFTGTVVASPNSPVSTAAFAVIGKDGDITDIHSARFERRQQPGPAVYDFADGARALTWVAESKNCPNTGCLDAASAFTFRLHEQRYLLVKWTSGFCESSYTLLSIGAELVVVATNDYDCDV